MNYTASDLVNPRVSVIVPAYNASRYIQRTLISAIRQSYTALEIIVVDDGSTDDTARLVEQIGSLDERIRLIRTSNRGVASARNTGIEASSGEFVSFLDADDLWHPTKIDKQVKALSCLPSEWAAVYCLHHVIDENDVLVRAGSSKHARGFILARHLTFRFVGNGSALLVRRQAAIDVQGFDASYAAAGHGGCEDFDFELKLVERYNIEVIPERLVGYREHPGNMSSNHHRMALGMTSTVRSSLRRNPELASFAANSAMSAAYRYAFIQYRKAHSIRLAVDSSFRIFWFSPNYFCLVLAVSVWRKLTKPFLTSTAERSDRYYKGRICWNSVGEAELATDLAAVWIQRHLKRLGDVDDHQRKSRLQTR